MVEGAIGLHTEVDYVEERVVMRKCMAKAKLKPVKEIPDTSLLAPLQRKGVEGMCFTCEKKISEHYGHRNVWVGCGARKIKQDEVFFLVSATDLQRFVGCLIMREQKEKRTR